MNTEYDDLLKTNVLQLVKQHKDDCHDPECGMSMHMVEVLIRKAGIEMTEQERMLCL